MVGAIVGEIHKRENETQCGFVIFTKRLEHNIKRMKSY